MKVLSIIAAFMILLGLATAAGEYRDIRRGLASESWPVTRGVVLHARYSRRMKRFEYAYAIGDRSFASTRVGYSISPFHQEYRRHDVGDTIQVYYDPSDPAESLVRPGVSAAGIIGGLLPPLILFCLGAALVVVVLRGD